MVVAVTPIVVADNFFFPFITGKGFFFRIVVEILVGMWALLAYRDPAYRPKPSYILYAIVALVGVMAIADIFSQNPEKSIWSNYERMEGLVTLVHLLAYFVVSVAVLSTTKLWERLMQVSLVASVYIAGYGVLQYAGALESFQSATRVEATFGNSAYLAIYALINVFFAVLLLMRVNRENWVRFAQVAYAGTAALNLFVLYHSGTRGTILGLLGGTMLTLLILSFGGKHRAKFRPYALGVIVFAIISAGSLVMFQTSSFVKESPVLSRFAPTAIIQSFVDARLPVWSMAFQGFLERPIFGWGQESFNYVFNEYYDPGMYAQEAWFDRAHNVFLDWLVAGGILGLLAYLALFGSLGYYLWFRPIELSYEEKALFTGLLAAYFIHNIFVFDNLMSYVLFFSILGFVHVLAVGHREVGMLERAERAIGKAVRDDGGADFVQIVVAGALTIAVLYTVNYAPIAQNKELIEALKTPAPSTDLFTQIEQALGNGQITSPEKLDEFLAQFLTGDRLTETKEILASGSVKTVGDAASLVVSAAQREGMMHFKTAIDYQSLGTAEVREHLAIRASQVISSEYVDENLKKEFAVFAATEMAAQAEALSLDARYQYMAGSFLAKIESAVQVPGVASAESYYLRAIELSPKKQMFLMDLGYFYLVRGDTVRALEQLKKAHELETKNESARISYAIGAIYAGDDTLAEQVLLPLGSMGKTDKQVLNAYATKERYAPAIKALEERALTEPNNFELETQLASFYALAGERAKAIKALEHAIELNPEYKAQGEYYIGEIKAGRNP